MDYMGEEYFKMKSTVVKYERFVLKVRACASERPHCELLELLCPFRNLASVYTSSTHTRLIRELLWFPVLINAQSNQSFYLLFNATQVIITYLQMLDMEPEKNKALAQNTWYATTIPGIAVGRVDYTAFLSCAGIT